MLGCGFPSGASTVIVDDDAGCSNTGSTCGRGGNPPCCKIQLAICNSVSGDLISVKPGTYAESIRMKPGVSVASEGGPNVTTINGAGKKCTATDYCGTTNLSCSAVLINSGVGSDVRLDGFKIMGGAGVHETFGSNPSKTVGGGIFISGNALITNNIISGNTLSGSDDLFYGAGIAAVATASPNTPLITNNTITGNKATPPEGTGQRITYGFGGGVYTGKSSRPTIENNSITSNLAGDKTLATGAQTLGQGGGIFVYGDRTQGSTIVTRNLISGNSARDFGGGVKVDSYPCDNGCPRTAALLTNNEIRGNDAGEISSSGEGGGIATYKANVTLANNTIHSNIAGIGGGHHKGLQTTGSDPDVVLDANNIYSSNTSRNASAGGGIHALTACHIVRNSDFWQNSSFQLAGACSDSVIFTNGNRQNDPLYLSVAANDFHLDPSSPLVDAGDNPDAPSMDREGAARPFDANGDGTATADIGEYERAADCDADGTPDNADSDDDNDGDPDATDCAPCNPSRYHGRAESCNGIDDNCDGIVDDEVDTDRDGSFNCTDPDDDNDGHSDEADCAPLVNSVYSAPGLVDNSIRFDSRTSFHWSRLVQSNVYNVYRGTILGGSWVYNHTCFETQSVDQSTTDASVPVAGQAFYYLIAAKNRCGEGGAGSGRSGSARPNNSPCSTSTTTDFDIDSVVDIDDDCAAVSNAGQDDLDNDTIGDSCDSDNDNDGADNAVDCAPLDPSAFGVPAEVSGVIMSGKLSTSVSWGSQNIGAGTRYDLATGSIAQAHANSFGPGTCLQNNAVSPPVTDNRSTPAPGQGFYYMVRSENLCGTGTYGSAQRNQHGSAGGASCP